MYVGNAVVVVAAAVVVVVAAAASLQQSAKSYPPPQQATSPSSPCADVSQQERVQPVGYTLLTAPELLISLNPEHSA